MRLLAKLFSARSLSRITAKTVSSPPSVPTTSGARMASIAIAAACTQTGQRLNDDHVLRSVDIGHALTENIAQTRGEAVRCTSRRRSREVYLMSRAGLRGACVVLISRSSLISREMVACVVLHPPARSARRCAVRSSCVSISNRSIKRSTSVFLPGGRNFVSFRRLVFCVVEHRETPTVSQLLLQYSVKSCCL